MNANLQAMLHAIRCSEGTATENGYRYLFGSLPSHERLFSSYADHPHIRFTFTKKDGRPGYTTAAGAYQFIYPTWDRLRRKLDLPDFSPASQDAAAIEVFKERGAYDDIIAGRWRMAVAKLAPEWASLPAGPYTDEQPSRSWQFVHDAYLDGGGVEEA